MAAYGLAIEWAWVYSLVVIDVTVLGVVGVASECRTVALGGSCDSDFQLNL